MFNYIIIYCIIGIFVNFIIEILCDALETPNRLSILEKIVVGLIWPWSIFKLINEFYKAKK
tara:strand:- start:308 stop:490 length:183 start_codon:yes stop_codon:yes gene_type:complete